ncbi:MAG: sulfotransferase family protein [Planctomycetota bacterium]|jgi:hypothetical protein
MAQPFFILGTGRCGSTMICRILQAHPQVALSDEAKAINFVWFCNQLATVPAHSHGEWTLQEPIRMRGLVQERYTESMARCFAGHARSLILDFYKQEFPDREFTHWGDKLPNPRAAAAMRALWPETRYILCLRDPRDVICSYRAFSARDDYRERFPHVQKMSTADHAVLWRNLNSSVAQDLAPLVIRYEDAIQNLHRTIGPCLAHLALPMHSDVQTAMHDRSAFESHGTSDSLESSVGRWRQELSAAEARQIESICGDAMTRFGYSIESTEPGSAASI